MFKICVVGCGGMSSGGHGPSFKKYYEDYPDVRLCACCDLDEEKARKYMERFGFETYYTDFNKMLDEIKPDVVSMIMPVNLTAKVSKEIMKKGYNIIMEKPPGLDRAEIESMIEVASEANVCVRTCFNRRYTPLVLKLKELLAADNEEILNITYQMYRYKRFDNDFATTAIHAIDVVKDIVGADYKKVDFTYQEKPECGESVANMFMTCTFENGVVGQITLVPIGGAVTERITVNTLNSTYFVELPVWDNCDSPGRLRCYRQVELVADICGADLVDDVKMYLESGFYDENRLYFEKLRASDEVFSDLESAIQSVEISNCLRERKATYVKK